MDYTEVFVNSYDYQEENYTVWMYLKHRSQCLKFVAISSGTANGEGKGWIKY